MQTLLINNVLLGNSKCDILIENKHFSRIVPAGILTEADLVLDADGKAIIPALYNTHCHAAMTIMRGYADDMPLDRWLNDYIWPFENNMTAADIRRGGDIAIEEMVSSGTVLFNDMYFEIEETIDSVDKSGMRAAIGITVMDNHSLAQTESKKQFVREFKDPTGGRIQLVIAPHAVYTVGKEKLKKCAAFARDNGLLLHIHVAETSHEVADCVARTGMTPVQYLDSIGFLGPDVIAAHCVHLTEKDADTLAERGVTISHCPCSNMKISSGVFNYALVQKAGCKVTLGTDGASSNNNLDLREEMKFAALLAKSTGNPELLPAKEIMQWATVNGAKAFGINAGEIREGKLADCILLDLNNVRMRPCHHLISNWVYSADSSCISNVICDGKIIL